MISPRRTFCSNQVWIPRMFSITLSRSLILVYPVSLILILSHPKRGMPDGEALNKPYPTFSPKSDFPTKKKRKFKSNFFFFYSQIFFRGDVWSFGVVMWEIFTKQIPFSQLRDPREVAEKVANKSISLEIPFSLPPVIQSLLSDCLIFDHEKRCCISDVVSVLSQFFQSHFSL